MWVRLLQPTVVVTLIGGALLTGLCYFLLLKGMKHFAAVQTIHEKWLDAHHVMHWADGGETSLDNTVLLCSTHHRLLHEGGFRINKGTTGEWQFKTAATGFIG